MSHSTIALAEWEPQGTICEVKPGGFFWKNWNRKRQLLASLICSDKIVPDEDEAILKNFYFTIHHGIRLDKSGQFPLGRVSTGRSMWRGPLLAVVFCSITLHLSAAVEKGASVTLAARWPGTSYLLEAAEMLAAEDPAHFWDFLRIASETKEPAGTEQCWSHIMAMASGLLPPSIAQVRASTFGTAFNESARFLGRLRA
eukprot:1138198-Pelagomonas_calceolata.AAC.3